MKKIYFLDKYKNDIVNYIKNNTTVVDVAKILNVPYYAVKNFMSKNNIRHKDFRFNHNFFENIDNEEKAYWLGFLMADGCVYKKQDHYILTLSLQVGDKSHIEKFHNAIESNRNIWHCYSKGHGSFNSQHWSDKMCGDLIKLGCTPRKSLTLEFPNIKKELLHHFIRGYFDGDGCVSFKSSNNIQIAFACGSLTFLENIKFYMELSPKIYHRPNSNCYTIVACGNKKVFNFYKKLYSNANIYLDRKKSIFDKFFNWRLN